MPKIGDILTEDFSTIKDLNTLEGINYNLAEAISSFFGALGASSLLANSKTDTVMRAWGKLEEHERTELRSAFGEDEIGNMALAMLKIIKFVENHVARIIKEAGVSETYLNEKLKAIVKRPDIDPETRELVEKRLAEDAAEEAIKNPGKLSWH